jgi:hypothetical protein
LGAESVDDAGAVGDQIRVPTSKDLEVDDGLVAGA